MHSLPDAVILCGGAGLRLRPVIGDSPKGMANVAGRPFLEILLRQLRRHAIENAVLAVGYQSEFIQAHFGESFIGLKLAYSVETSALGAGGAVRQAV